MQENQWTEQLNALFAQIEDIATEAKTAFSQIYDERGLSWDDHAMKSLSGDIHTKVLGAYLARTISEQGINANFSYEVKLTRSGLRADLVIDERVEIESKAQGIFSLADLHTRWDKLSRERPDMVHALVGWRHNPTTISRIREFIPESNHFYFHNLQTHQNQPGELNRLVTSIVGWLEE